MALTVTVTVSVPEVTSIELGVKENPVNVGGVVSSWADSGIATIKIITILNNFFIFYLQ